MTYNAYYARENHEDLVNLCKQVERIADSLSQKNDNISKQRVKDAFIDIKNELVEGDYKDVQEAIDENWKELDLDD